MKDNCDNDFGRMPGVPPLCLTVAGSDPGGGAGIQGDLKTFCAFGVYGMAVITALTAQNTVGVTGVQGVPAGFVGEQLEAIFADMPPQHVKTGMLLNAGIINMVADSLGGRDAVDGRDSLGGRDGLIVIVDPVMISSSGDRLLENDAVAAYVDRLFPMGALVTPNSMETQHFTGIAIECVDDAVRASERLIEMGARAVVVKGGDTNFREGPDKLYDVLNVGGEVHIFEREVVGSRNSHGTGCAFAAAVCSLLALGRPLVESVDLAGRYVGGALRHSFPTGSGAGSIHHLWNNCSKDVANFDEKSPGVVS